MKALAWLLLAGAAHAAVLDDLRDASPWKASASDQVKATLARDRDGSLCLQADFNGVSGYAVMRRELPVAWPADFDLGVRWKGGGAVNDVQVKFADASGDNVWWIPRPSLALPKALADVRFKRRHVSFAWGPTTDRALRETKYVEFVISAGREGGQSTLCVASLSLAPRAPDPAAWPEPLRHEDARGLTLDLHAAREFNGVLLRWPAPPGAYALDGSDDGRRWRTLQQVRGSRGAPDALFLPESEARFLRVQRARPGPLPSVELKGPQDWPDRNAVLATLAAAQPRGTVPRAFRGEQNYWTIVGVDGGGERSGLIGEDGAIEVTRGGFSVEPAVQVAGRWVTWADATVTHTLAGGHLPLPQVRWAHEALTLEIDAAADGPPDAPQLLARYTLRNTGTAAQRFTLMLAVRPWQVNPPQQFLNTPGGVRPLGTLRREASTLWADGRPVTADTPPARMTALPYDGGIGLDALAAAPALKQLQDPQAQASAALQWTFTLAPGESRRIGWSAPLGAPRIAAPGDLDARFAAAEQEWRQRLERVLISAGPTAAPIVATLRSTLAQMLVSRDRAALRPGTRSYARTWIRDGAMMVAGLVRLGEIDTARDFVDDFAPRIFESGKVPCCVDARGADPTPENDSHGQYLYAVAEVWRHTRDDAWLARHWPRIVKVVAYLEQLRAQTRDQEPPLRGLLPPSISHEGYSDKPAYSYWDDFWALRGYKDAVMLARALGREPEARAWAAARDAFETDLTASVQAVAARTGFIAGAADRGDFDATSTTVALNPAQAALPAALLQATFERYWQEALSRSEGRRAWKDYTPYELRTVGALVRLGQPQRAHAMLDFFFRDQRPAGWNQWAEVVMRDPREPHFLGDMPHAWVASDYVRSALDLFAYETDAALVIGAGWTAPMLAAGIGVQNLSTAFGRLDYRVSAREGGWALALASPLRGPAILAWPLPGALPSATHEGRALEWDGARRQLVLPPAPATVLLQAPR